MLTLHPLGYIAGALGERDLNQACPLRAAR